MKVTKWYLRGGEQPCLSASPQRLTFTFAKFISNSKSHHAGEQLKRAAKYCGAKSGFCCPQCIVPLEYVVGQFLDGPCKEQLIIANPNVNKLFYKLMINPLVIFCPASKLLNNSSSLCGKIAIERQRLILDACLGCRSSANSRPGVKHSVSVIKANYKQFKNCSSTDGIAY